MTPARWLAGCDRLYRALLSAYPPAFRQRFAAEMAQVYHELCRETLSASGPGGLLRLWLPALLDGLVAVIFQWWLRLARERIHAMPPEPLDRNDPVRPLTAAQAGLAALPFLLFGLSSLLTRLDFFRIAPPAQPSWPAVLVYPYPVFYGLDLVGLLAGLLAGSPRWAFSYLGWALFFGAWWTGAVSFGYQASWWMVWTALLGVLLMAVLIRRSLQPLRALLSGLWQDWTLFSFGIYIFYGSTFMIYDENHSPYLLAFIVITTLAASLCAWRHFQAISPLRRVGWLALGIVLMAVIGAINDSTWDYAAYYNLPVKAHTVNPIGLVLFILLSLILLANGLLARWRIARDARLKKQAYRI